MKLLNKGIIKPEINFYFLLFAITAFASSAVFGESRFSDKSKEALCENSRSLFCVQPPSSNDNSDWTTVAVPEEAGAKVCADMPRTGDKLECIKKVAEEPAVTADKSAVEDSATITAGQRGRNEAVQFCRLDVPGYDKDSCLKIASQARFIDTRALSLCAKAPDHSKEDCLASILDKVYVPGVIEECAEATSSSDLEQCLSEYGLPVNELENAREDQAVTVIQLFTGSHNESLKCAHENFYGKYPEGGGCSFDGCWIAGGGCNFDGCWGPGGHCDIFGCVNPAPAENICQ